LAATKRSRLARPISRQPRSEATLTAFAGTSTGTAIASFQRLGDIVNTGGPVDISVPYTVSFTGNGDPETNGSAQFMLVLFDVGVGMIDSTITSIRKG
jgi:hypothetical protein